MAIQDDVVSLLGIKLDEVANSAFVRSLNAQPHTELINDRFYMKFVESGLLIDADLDGKATSVFLYSEGHENYNGFKGRLPEEISFADNRSEISRKLGKPSASSNEAGLKLFGRDAPSWDRFDRDSYSLHVQYDYGERSVSLVTIMRPDCVPK